MDSASRRPVSGLRAPIASVTGLRAPIASRPRATPASPGTGRGGAGPLRGVQGPPPERERGLHVRDAPHCRAGVLPRTGVTARPLPGPHPGVQTPSRRRARRGR